MRPHDSLSKRGARRAAKTHLRQAVGWLRGFPTSSSRGGGVSWVTLPRPGWPDASESLQVDGAWISGTVRRLGRLSQRFPRALPDLVGDVVAWRSRIDSRLEVLKACQHEGAALPRLEALLDAAALPQTAAERLRQAVERHRGLQPLFLAVLWAGWADVDTLMERVAVVEREPEGFLGVLLHAEPTCPGGAIALAHRLLDLRTNGELGAELLRLLADQRLWHLPPSDPAAATGLVEEFRRASRDGLRVLESRQPKSGELAQELSALVMSPWSSRGERRRTLELVGLLAGAESLDESEVFWARLDRLRRDLARQLDPQRRRADVVAELLEQVQALEPRACPATSIVRLLGAVDGLDGRGYEPLVAILSDLPRVYEGDRVREALIRALEWPKGALGGGAIVEVLECVRAVQQEIDHCPASPRRSDYLKLLVEMVSDLVWEFVHEARPRHLLRMVGKAAPRVIREVESRAAEGGPALGAAWLEHLTAQLAAGADASQAATVAAAMPVTRAGTWLSHEELVCAARLAGRRGGAYETLVDVLQGDRWTQEARSMLSRLMAHPGMAPMLAPLLLGGSGREVLHVLQSCQQLEALDRGALRRALDDFGKVAPLRPAAGEALDVGAYPAELASVLEELARHDPAARRTAARVLGQHFPTRSAREREAAYLRATLPRVPVGRRARLSSRLERLATWRVGPLSPTRLRRYEEELRRRTHLARLRRLNVQVRSRLEAAVVKRFSTPDLLAAIEERGQQRVVAAIASQAPFFRKLGFRLLHLRAARSPPWDLRDEGKNRTFCERARAGGLHLEPWLDAEPPVEAQAADGTRLLVAIERDPIEVMRMGQPFDTCLSPGSFNFFAAIGNAADVNKQVLYARDERGAIRGRCLLALTTDLGILTHQPYTARRQLRFDLIAGAFARDLARRMGTAVALRGSVERLLVPEWYCDMPHDLTGYREALDALRVQLPSLREGELARRLKEALGLDTLPLWVISAVVEWGELAERPTRLLELRDLLDPERLPADTLVRAAGLLRQAGEVEMARALLQPVLDRARGSRGGGQARGDVNLEGRLARELVLLGDPAGALRLLRTTRESDVRSWADEYSVRRLEAAGMANEALYRRARARELYALALRKHCYGAAESVRGRLAALDAPHPLP